MTLITNVKQRRLHIADLLDLQELSGSDVSKTRAYKEALGGFSSVFGFDYEGYNEAGDVITETTDGFPLNRMWDEFQKVIRLWNSQRDALTNMLTFNVTQLVEGVRYPVEGDFQEATEYGEPTGIRMGPSFRMGYDFRWWDLAIRYTWMYLAEASQQQLQALNNEALEADNRLMFTRVMRAVFNDVTRTADIDGESVNVYPFYNGDSQVPPRWKTTSFSASHEHYITSGAASVDSGDLDTLTALLTEHGYTMSRGYRLVIMVNPQEGDIIRGFNRPDGDKYDFIPNAASYGGGIIIQQGTIVGAPDMTQFAGLLTIGSYGPAVIVEEEYIPAGYMLAFATAGVDNIGNPVGIRQHEQSGLRGLRLVKGRDNDYPLIDSFYLHGFGTGVRHRGAGAVMQITAAGAYTIPADYD